jgi:hypothetical protein
MTRRTYGQLSASRYTGLLVAAGLTLTAIGDAVAKPKAWDKVENIKEAAAQIGEIQKTRGAEGAMKFIDACYRTHRLASAYNRWFEGCMVQDFMQSRALALIYERLPPDKLKAMGAPSAEQLMGLFQVRVASALATYNVSQEDAVALFKLTEIHGMPKFLAIVFPAGPGAPATKGGSAKEGDR